MGKETFIIYTSFYKPISFLSDKQLGRLFRAIFRYNLGEVFEVEDDIRMAFEFFKNQLEIDEAKYQAKIMRDIENGRKGGNPNFKKGMPNPYRKKNNEDIANDNPPLLGTTSNNPQLLEETQDKAINDNDNDNESKETSSNEEAKKAWLSLEAKEQELRNLESLLKAKEEELAKREAALKAKSGGTPPNLDFVSEEFKSAFQLWLDYKRERKESYKSEKSLKIAYNQLVKLSGNNPDTAKLIVEQSIASNWQGLFELKNKNHNKPNIADYDNSRQYTEF